MVLPLADVRREWRQFKDDRPGERFANHRARMAQKSRAHAAVSLALGALLLAAGTVLLFIPGPGLPLILFGGALIAAHSHRLSEQLDRSEPRVRDAAHRTRQWWRARSHVQRIALVTALLAVVAAGLGVMWKWVVVAYMLPS